MLDNGVTYRCDGIGTATGPDLVIGGAYNGLPVTEIKANAFQNNYSIKRVTILDTITSLPNTSFGSCASLTELNLSIMLSGNIGLYEFDSTGITEITIPPLVKNVFGRSFSNCKQLKTVKFLGTPALIQDTVFLNSTNITDIYVPWAEGAVANAPWGATNATIHYNS